MRTFLTMLRAARPASAARRRPANRLERASAERCPAQRVLVSEAGDSLIEVLISAVIVALIVVGTFSGLDSTNRATSLQRSRSQASALAEQNEEQLRSEPVKQLAHLSETHETVLKEVSENGTVYKIAATAESISDKTATSSCTSTAPSVDYIQTTSKVTWPSMGVTKPVVETSVVSPPAGSALIIQVTGASGEAVTGMTATTLSPPSPTSASALTSSNGCAILIVSPGEYALNVNRTGYVDQNGYANSSEDSFYNAPFYVVAENTAKKSFEFAPAGELAVTFENPTSKLKVPGETFVALNTLSSPSYRVFGLVEKPVASVESGKKLFPFSSPYTIYAGSCPADAPTANGQSSNLPLTAPPGGRAEQTVALPPLSGITVRSGTAAGSSTEGSPISAEGTILDTGCQAEGTTVKRSFPATPFGKLLYPGLPYGKYSLCVTATVGGKPLKKTVAVPINTPAGPSQVVYLGSGEPGAGCP